MRIFILVLATALVGTGAVLGAMRVFDLESNELERVMERTLEARDDEDPAEPRRRLLLVRLGAGEDVIFEVCARDGLPPDRWAGAVDFAVWNPDAGELVVSAPLDRELLDRARRSSQGACVVIGSGTLEVAGRYAIEAVWPDRTLPAELARVPLRAHVIAHRPLQETDRRPVWLVFAGMLVGLVGLARWRGATTPETTTGRGAMNGIAIGIAALLAAMVVLAFVPFWGSTAGLVRGALLAGVQVVAAIVLIRATAGRATRGEALGLVMPLSGAARRWARILGWVSLALAPLVGVLLWIAGGLVTQLVPATGEAPIETLVAWPSGALSFAMVALLVPLAEEVFFRGLVYGAAERRYGWRVAFAVSVLLFALAHLPQQWGAWGAFSSVLLTGAVLTGLRAATRSTLVPVLAHLGHNLTIALLATS